MGNKSSTKARPVAFPLLLISLLLCAPAVAAPLRFKVTDQTGAPFPGVLVIIKSLEGKGEIFRALTDAAGSVPEGHLARGLYRVIATCPYGICETKVSEFLVGETPVEFELKVDVSPTRGNVVRIGPSSRLRVQVLDAQGRPAASAELLVRDSDAQNERWYKANSDGETEVELPEAPVTFAALYRGAFTEETVSGASLEKLMAKGGKVILRLK